jgi:hypothetical protein
MLLLYPGELYRLLGASSFYNFINLYYRKNSESVLEERIRELNDNLRRKDEQISSLQRTQAHPTSTRASQEELPGACIAHLGIITTSVNKT